MLEEALVTRRSVPAVAAEPDPIKGLEVGALAFFEFVDENRPQWQALLSNESSPVTTGIAGIRTRQADLVVTLLTDGARSLGMRRASSFVPIPS